MLSILEMCLDQDDCNLINLNMIFNALSNDFEITEKNLIEDG